MYWGKTVITLSLIITLFLYLLSLPSLSQLSNQPLKSLSQIFSLFGLTLLTSTYILSTRTKLLETLFGPLDSVYRLHSTMGISAFVLLLNHPLLLAIEKLSHPATARLYLLPGPSLNYNLGIYSLYLMVVLVMTTLYNRLPYHIWKSTHNWMGLVIFLGGIHGLSVSQNVANFPPLKLWLITLVGLSILSAVYKRFFQLLLGPVFTYSVSSINQVNDLVEFTLAPLSTPLNFKAGQFVFARFRSHNFDSEPHPFSISSPPGEPTIRLSVKISGDYTLGLTQTKVGDQVKLIGPYGRFFPAENSDKPIVLIVGGIGITPMLSLIPTLVNKRVHLFYSAKTARLAYYHSLLVNLSRAGLFTYHLHTTDTDPRLTIGLIRSSIHDFTSSQFLLCGPQSMTRSLESQLLAHKIKRRQIILEDFSFT